MEATNICEGCFQIIQNREFLTCSICNNNYDLECANVSTQRFYNTLTKEHREKWKCQLCINKMPKKNNTNTPIRPQPSTNNNPINPETVLKQRSYYNDDESNITLRKKVANPT